MPTKFSVNLLCKRLNLSARCLRMLFAKFSPSIGNLLMSVRIGAVTLYPANVLRGMEVEALELLVSTVLLGDTVMSVIVVGQPRLPLCGLFGIEAPTIILGRRRCRAG